MRKTSALVESGILAAIAIVMALIAMYVPVIGAFVNFVWPLPIIASGVRNGLKWSFLTTLVAGIICAMLINPLQAFVLVAVFGILGLILGECMRRNTNPFAILTFGSMGGLLALVINFAIAFWIMGIDPVQIIFSSFDQSLAQMAEFQRSHGISEADIAASIASYKELIKMMHIIMPGAFLLTAPVLALINWWVAKKILSKLGNQFQDLPPFRELTIPGWCVVPYALSLFGVGFFLKNYPETWYYYACVNCQMIFSTLFVLQGLSLIYWYIFMYDKPRWWGHLACCLVCVQIVSLIVLWIGAFDCIADFRKIRGKKL